MNFTFPEGGLEIRTKLYLFFFVIFVVICFFVFVSLCVLLLFACLILFLCVFLLLFACLYLFFFLFLHSPSKHGQKTLSYI